MSKIKVDQIRNLLDTAGVTVDQLVALVGTSVTSNNQLKVSKLTAGSSLNIDLDVANGITAYYITLSAANCALTFTNETTPSGFLRRVVIYFKQTTGNNKVSFPANIKFQGGTAPVLATVAGATDAVRIETDLGVTTSSAWLGYKDGSWPA